MRDDRRWVITGCVAALLIGVAVIVVASITTGVTASALVAGVAAIGIGVVLAVVSTKDPFRGARVGGRTRAPENSRAHVLDLSVGESETHAISYRWDQVWGWLTVTVDDRLITRQLVLITFRLLSVTEFDVGDQERHRVRIEKRRPLVASFGRTQPITGFVDGIAVGSAE